MWSLMSRRRSSISKPVPTDDFKGFRWIECYIDTAINPVTMNQVTLTTPVRLGCHEDFEKFNDQWEQFCKLLSGDPDEVYFILE